MRSIKNRVWFFKKVSVTVGSGAFEGSGSVAGSEAFEGRGAGAESDRKDTCEVNSLFPWEQCQLST
jgi:hypothetical protein